MEPDIYHSIKRPTSGTYRDRGSKFISYAFPIENEEDVKSHLNALKKEHYNANHHVFAYKLGSGSEHYRASDDGEPANSSGKPVLGQILSHKLSDVLIVVVRYFGGVKLGVPGLINAYRTAADEALQNAEVIEKIIKKQIYIEFGYPLLNQILRLTDEENIDVLLRNFNETCKLKLNIRMSRFDPIKEKLQQTHGIKIIDNEIIG